MKEMKIMIFIKKKIKGIVEVKIRVTNLQLKCVTLMKLVTSFNEQKNK
jgi:hypothetical protein